MGGFHMRDPNLIHDEHGPALPSQSQIAEAIQAVEAMCGVPSLAPRGIATGRLHFSRIDHHQETSDAAVLLAEACEREAREDLAESKKRTAWLEREATARGHEFANRVADDRVARALLQAMAVAEQNSRAFKGEGENFSRDLSDLVARYLEPDLDDDMSFAEVMIALSQMSGMLPR